MSRLQRTVVWLKRIAISLAMLVLVTLLLIWLAVGRLGSPTLLSKAVSYAPSLSIGEINGGLSSTLIVNELKYRTETLDVSVAHIELTLRWGCLLQFSLCADSLISDGIDVRLLPAATRPQPSSESNQIIMLPILVVVDSLLATNTQLQLADGTLVNLDSITTGIRVYRRLRLLSPKLEGLEVKLAEAPTDTETPADDAAQIARQDIQLNDIFIPVHAEITKLSIVNATLDTGSEKYHLTSLLFDGNVKGHQVNVTNMRLTHAQGELDAHANITLSDQFPLTASLKVNAKPADLPKINANLTLGGSLYDLRLEVRSSLPFQSELNATLSPLSGKLPVDMHLSWQSFNQSDLSPVSIPNFDISDGALEINGNINDYKVQVTTELGLAELSSPVKIEFNSLVNPQRIDLDVLNLGMLGGNAVSSGKINLSDTMNWQLATTLKDLNGQLIDPRLPTNIRGTLDYQGQLIAGKPNLNLKSIDISATQQGFPLSIHGSGAYSGTAGVIVGSLKIAHQQNHIQGFARMLVDRRVDADLIINIDDLNKSVPGAAGEVRGNLLVFGDTQVPNVELMLNASSLATTDEDGSLFAIADNVQMSVKGTTAAQMLNLDVKRADLTASLKSEISKDATKWRANITQATISNDAFHAVLENNSEAIYDPSKKIATLDNLCWQINNQGQACIAQLKNTEQSTDLKMFINDLAINDWLQLSSTPLPIASDDAQLSASINGSYSNSNGFVADIEGDITDSNWRIGEKARNLMVNIDPAQFKISANRNIIKSDIVLTSQSIGSIKVQASFDSTPSKQDIQAEIVANNLFLAPFVYLSDDINQLDGVFDAQLSIKGQPTSPELKGSLELRNAIVDIARAPAVITDWNASIDFDRFNANYTSNLKLGGGLAELTGNINWQQELSLNAELNGELLNVNYQDIEISFSPQITASYQQQKLTANGTVTVPKANIVVKTLPENAVTPSRDVHLRGEPEPTSVMDIAEVDLQILIDPERDAQVKLDAFGLSANLAGQMRLTTQPTLMGFGDLQIINGEYRAYGQELVIRTGEVQFNGPFSQPLLFIEAIRDPQLTEDGVIAGIVIDGIASQPNIRLFSEPGMDQSANLAYMLTGRGDIGGSEVDNNAFAGILVGFGVSNSGGITGGMGEALGINDLQLSAKGSGKNTQVAVSGTIAPNLTLEYGVGVFESVSEVRLRYKLMPKLFVEATSGLEQSLILYYEFAVGEVKSKQ